MKIGVTGSSGHIGVNLIPELIKKGYTVRALVHRNQPKLTDDAIEYIHGDILDRKAVQSFTKGLDMIVHLAAKITIEKSDQEVLKINVEGTHNLLNAASRYGIRRFIHFSSIHSLHSFPFDQELNESRPLNLNSTFDYDRAKALAEKLVMEASEKGLNTLILNPTAVIGPNDFRPSYLGRAIIWLYKGKIPALVKGGYDWVDVRDVISATLQAVEYKGKYKKFMLSGTWKSMKELAEAIHGCGGAKPPSFTVPFWLAKAGTGLLNYLSGSNTHRLFTSVSLESLQNGHHNISHALAEKELDYKPRDFKDTIMETIISFRTNGMI